jgi:hypothetical protein
VIVAETSIWLLARWLRFFVDLRTAGHALVVFTFLLEYACQQMAVVIGALRAG